MNFKQKLTYMLIGSLFTLAGYFLTSLGGGVFQETHAQQNGKEVIEKIVCKQIEVVDDLGKPVVVIGKSLMGGGRIGILKDEGGVVIEDSAIKLYSVIDGDLSSMMYPGQYWVYDSNGLAYVQITSLGIDIRSPDMRTAVSIGRNIDGGGYINVNNTHGKKLVTIGNTKGRPNDGLINVYNHTGEWRSISTD